MVFNDAIQLLVTLYDKMNSSRNAYRNATYMLIDTEDILEDWRRTTTQLRTRMEQISASLSEINNQVSEWFHAPVHFWYRWRKHDEKSGG